MKCASCQAMNDPNAAFCGNCGATVAAMPSPDSPGFMQPAGPTGPAGPAGPTAGAPYQPGGPAGPYSRSTPSRSREFQLNLRRLSRADQVVGGATLIVFISVFLPWFGFSELGESFSVSGTTAHGYLVIAVIIAVVIMAYLLLCSGWDELPVKLPIAHSLLLLIGTGAQFLLVFIGFIAKPVSGLSWEIGAYLGLLAAVAAVAPVLSPAIRSLQSSN
jgi:hypothetical protein